MKNYIRKINRKEMMKSKKPHKTKQTQCSYKVFIIGIRNNNKRTRINAFSS